MNLTCANCFFLIFFCFLGQVAECSPGNEPDQNAGAASGSINATTSESGMEALLKNLLENRMLEYLSKYGKRPPQQRVFDGLKASVKLESATPADLAKMARIIERLTGEKFPSPGEAASRLINEYSVYYQARYNNSCHL